MERAGPEQRPGDGADESIAEQRDCLARLSEARQEADALREKYLRAAAEVENARKWGEREASSRAAREKKEFLRQLLEVLDNLERALRASGEAPELKKGVEIVLNQLEQALAREGLERIPVKPGQPYDPFYQEAVQVSQGEAPRDTVAEVLQPGYLHEGTVLRPARVTVVRQSSPNG